MGCCESGILVLIDRRRSGQSVQITPSNVQVFKRQMNRTYQIILSSAPPLYICTFALVLQVVVFQVRVAPSGLT
jgi:hypothetical protein